MVTIINTIMVCPHICGQVGQLILVHSERIPFIKRVICSIGEVAASCLRNFFPEEGGVPLGVLWVVAIEFDNQLPAFR